MGSIFDDACAAASDAVDLVYGESFQFFAMTATADVDSVRAPDGRRPTFTAAGAYVGPSKSLLPHARPPERDRSAPQYAASVPWVTIDNAALAWPVVQGDRLARLKTGELFEVSRVLPDGVRRTVLHLTARKRVVPVPAFAPSLRFSDPRNSQYLGQVV